MLHLHLQEPPAFVLGTNEIASAVAVYLHKAGWPVILSHDPHPPVIRRGMAFHDCLFGDSMVVEGVVGESAETSRQIADILTRPDRVAVTALHLTDLLAAVSPHVLVDARMQKHSVTPSLRHVARITVGLGPNFLVGVNCDIAVETRPARSGTLVTLGATDKADGIAGELGGYGAERFVYAQRSGRWHTAVDIGVRVFKGFVLGHLAGEPIEAPLDGQLRGIVRDGALVPQGVKLLEIDPRGRKARWTGIDDRGRVIAEATLRAIKFRMAHGNAVTTQSSF